jgi:HEAT repeat protein
MLNSIADRSALYAAASMLGLLLLITGCQTAEGPRETPPGDETPTSSEIARRGPTERLTAAILNDPDDEVSRMGLVALRGDSLPGIQRLLASDNVEVRSAGIDTLKQITAEGSVELLIQSLGDPDESIRLEVVEALGEWRNTKATSPLIELYPKEQDPQVRYEILTTLGLIGSPEAIPLLEQATGDDDRYVRMWGMDALCTMRAPNAEVLGLKLLKDTDSFVRMQVLRSCRSLFLENDTTAAILETIFDAPSFVEASWGRKILEAKIAGTRGNSDREIIRQASLAELETERRVMAALLLAEVGDQRAIPALHEIASDPNPQVRHHVAYRLGQLAAPESIPTLIVLLQDSDPLVSGTASGALLQWDNASHPAVQKATAAYTGPRLAAPQ